MKTFIEDTKYQAWFLECFDDLYDPRDEAKTLYPLDEILLVALATVISGGDSWDDMVLFGDHKLRFLKQWLPFENGTPSAVTYERVFSVLDPKHFAECLNAFMAEVSKDCGGDVPRLLVMDGKVVRGSHDHKHDKSPIHLVNIWCHAKGITIAQEKVADKSNEITAIPKLLDAIDISGAVISIDAMGCQRQIASQIRDMDGDYILALKGNHGKMHEEVKTFFARHEALDFKGRGYEFLQYEDVDKGHGRVEQRNITLLHKVGWLTNEQRWEGLASVAMIESICTTKGKTTTERRYYISSLKVDAPTMLGLIRSHWGIENSLNWVLDMSFNEDKSRIRCGHADHNMATLRRLALSLIKLNKNAKHSIKGTRKIAGWDDFTLKKILMF
jgi:predicted transposase YbfD/YdcC